MWPWWVLALLSVAVAAKDGSKVVRTSQGDVKGYKDSEGKYYEFYNIPYASAPLGKFKFGPPLPPPAWLRAYEAVDEKIVCPQASLYGVVPDDMKVTNECLIANVFVPVTEAKNLSVVVYVHGGAYQVGYGNLIKFKEMAEGKAIIVTFNYRLGIHGFLCLGTKDVPGNAGMKDQVALLRWVKKNIAGYGGNPNDVTIAGYSAGSSSVDLLMLSKSAKGLFNKVIPESGANVAAFSIQTDPLEIAKEFARSQNFTNVDDVYALEDFYQTASRETLTSSAFFDRADSTFAFVPCVERETKQGEVFLDKSPVSILKSGQYKKVPILYGFAKMEGLLRINLFETWKHKMNEKFSDFLPGDLKFESPEEKEEVANKVKQFYFGDQPVGDDNIVSYVDFFSDVIFAYPTLRAVNYHVEAGHKQVYLYEYSFTDENTPVIPHTDIRGASHCSQTMAVADHKLEYPITEDLKSMKDVSRQLWINFITTGTPVPEGSSLPSWPPVDRNCSPHMSLDRTLELRGPLLEERTQFWERIYDKYYREPIPPPTPPTRHSEL